MAGSIEEANKANSALAPTFPNHAPAHAGRHRHSDAFSFSHVDGDAGRPAGTDRGRIKPSSDSSCGCCSCFASHPRRFLFRLKSARHQATNQVQGMQFLTGGYVIQADSHTLLAAPDTNILVGAGIPVTDLVH
jgi:hypothetical protein